MKVKDLPELERPRERLLQVGVENLSNEELLSIILKNGTKNKSVKEMSLEILQEINGIANFKMITKEKLLQIKGIGPAQAFTLLSVVELGRRIYQNHEFSWKTNLHSAQDIYDLMQYELKDKKQEYFYCLYVNSKKELLERKLLFMGTVNRSIVHPREVFKHAYLCSASGIICIHNHPSGDVTPSKEDIHLTNSLVELGKVNGIPILDHIIIGDNQYYSFYDDGQIMNL